MLTTPATPVSHHAGEATPINMKDWEMNHRSILRWVAAVGVLGTLLTPALPTASALPISEGIIDLSISVESIPDVVVAQPQAGTIYRITVTNAPVGTSGGAIVTGNLPAGFALTGGDPRCSVSGSAVTCNLTVLPGTSEVLDLQASVSQTTGSYDFTVAVESTDITEPLEFKDNNTATTSTSVVTADEGGGHPAYVCAGCSITFSDPEIGSAALFVPAESNGVIVRLSKDASLAGQSCGEVNGKPATCQVGLNVWFDEEEEDYQVEDPTNPIQVHYTPVQEPCHGLGTPTCAPIGYYDPDKGGDPKPMPVCDGAGKGDQVGANEAFVNGVYHVCKDWSYKAAGKVRHVVLMKSKDPTIPPLYL